MRTCWRKPRCRFRRRKRKKKKRASDAGLGPRPARTRVFMADSIQTETPRTSLPPPRTPGAPADEESSRYWFSRHSKSIAFLTLTLAVVGCYLAFSIPVEVFPATNFPRIIIGADNGVMPIDQMMVTITRPLEEAVNSVPGLLNVKSITSRGSAEIDLFFDWNVDMFQTLQYVNAALSRAQTELPSSAKVEAHRLTFAS